METLTFDLTKEYGTFKPMNATNGGPWHKRFTNKMYSSNFDTYQAARIPYSRNHDLAVHSVYGGPYSHDISCIFPNFDANPYDPKSYDFGCTDEDILTALEAGTKTFFRLGQTIENQITKHHTFPPKDFKKWAVICEHIVRHYNLGWADGYHLDMDYWEIWNEPDLDEEFAPKKRTWGGTNAEFFDFFETVAKHLKACFPDIKVGGPALAFRDEWAELFLKEMSERKVPLDFYSWHIYLKEPEAMKIRAEKMKNLLKKYGYDSTENISDEWNYVKGWTDEFPYTIEMIHGIKGAVVTLSTMCVAQQTSLDMLMYYDTRPSVFNGVFDFYTKKPLKGYYAFYWYGMFYDRKAEVRAINEIKNIYSLCGVDENGKTLTVIAHYSDDDTTTSKTVSVDFGRTGQYEIYLLDKDHDGDLINTTSRLEFDMPVHSAVLIKEI